MTPLVKTVNDAIVACIEGATDDGYIAELEDLLASTLNLLRAEFPTEEDNTKP